MSDWWNKYEVGDSAVETGDWWKKYEVADLDATTVASTESPAVDPPTSTSTSVPFYRPQTPLENQYYLREKELETGLPRDLADLDALEKRYRDMKAQGAPEADAALVDWQVAQRNNEVSTERIARDKAAMERMGLSPQEYRRLELYRYEQEKLGPDMRLANLPPIRGAMQGAQTLASVPLELGARATGNEEFASQLADSRAEDAAQNAVADQQQGKVASYVRQGAEMLAKYTPAGAVGAILPTIGAETLATKLNEGRNSGMTQGQALGYAGLHATKDVVLTWLGGKVAGAVGGRTLEQTLGMGGGAATEKSFGQFAKQLAKSTAVEIGVEEWPQYFGEAIIDKYMREDYTPKSWGEIGRDLTDIAAMTALMQAATAPIDTASPADKKKIRAAKEFVDKPSRRNAMKAGLAWLTGRGDNTKAETPLETQADRSRVAGLAKDAITAKEFKSQLDAVASEGKISKEQSQAIYDLTAARAKAAGEGMDEYIGKRVKGVENAKWADFKDKNGRAAADALGHGAQQTETPEFANWFGDSKVVKPSGRPAVMYHGTARAGFNEFDTYGSEYGLFGSGSYFTDDPGVGSQYAKKGAGDIAKRGGKATEGVYPVYLSIKNPIDMDGKADIAAWANTYPAKEYGVDLSGVKTNEDAYRALEEAIANEGLPKYEGADIMQSAIREMGHDGITHIGGGRVKDGSTRHRVYIAFDPEQIKSAIGNSGSFDPDNPNILAQSGEPTSRVPKGWDSMPSKPDVVTGRRAEISFFAEDGRAVIRAFESANFVSMVHEMGHLFRRDLAGPELNSAATWAGAKDGKWNRAAEEKFARGFEQYMLTGQAPTKKLAKLFDRVATWMKGVYNVVSRAPNVQISPEMRGVYDSLFTPQQAQQATVEQQTQPEPQSEQQASQDSAPPQSDTLGQDIVDRFRGLANHSEIQQVRDENYVADEALGVPERRKWAEANAEAVARMKANPDGELQAMLAKIRQANESGGTLDLSDMVDMALAAKLKEAAALDIINNPESRQIHRTINQAFRNARTQYARVLGMRDPTATPQQRAQNALVDAIMRPNDSEQASLDKAKTPADRKATEDAIDERIKRAIEELKAEGIDATDIEGLLRDKMKSLRVLDKFRRSTSMSDMLFEYWRNAILSGPKTHAANIIGNAAFAGMHYAFERPAEAVVNLFVRNPNSTQLGEFKYLLGGIGAGIKRGARNALTSFQLESSALADELGREGDFKIEGPRGAIPGKAGRLIRTMGYRPLLAADEFFKSITATMEAGAYAYRAGKKNGLTGDALSKFIHEQTSDLGSAVWDLSLAKAEHLAFQGDHGVVAEGLKAGANLVRKFPGGRWLVPFRDTPAAIFEQGLKRTPVLGAIVDYANARRNGESIVEAGMTPTLARQGLAALAVMAAWDMLDPEDPRITGTENTVDPNGRKLAYQTNPPMSVRIGGTWYSYERIEPIATMLAYTVDVTRSARTGNATDVFKAASLSPLRQVRTKSFLEGLQQILQLIDDFSHEDAAGPAQMASRMASTFIPNIYRQLVSAADPYIPESRVWGNGNERLKRILSRTAQQARIPGAEFLPRYDWWGRKLRYSDSLGNYAADMAWALLSPVKAKSIESVHEVDAMLLRWNQSHPGQEKFFSEPAKSVTHKGVIHSLTDEQYAEYAELSGKKAAELVSGIKINVANPTKPMIDAVLRKMNAARTWARNKLKKEKWIKEWGQIAE